jgi:polyisoprenoid-binding protein YceI
MLESAMPSILVRLGFVFVLGLGCSKTKLAPVALPDLPQAVVAEAREPAAPAAAAKQFEIDPAASSIVFAGSNLTTESKGRFSTFSGSLAAPGNDPTHGSATVTIELSSVQTGADGLTKHLKSPDFFDVAKHPTATFVTTAITPGGERGASHTVQGNLELRGIKKSLSFPANLSLSDQQATLKAKFLFDRQAFGVKHRGSADNLIRDLAMVELDLVAKPK